MEELATASLRNGSSEEKLVTIFGKQRLLVLIDKEIVLQIFYEKKNRQKNKLQPKRNYNGGLVNAVIIQETITPL